MTPMEIAKLKIRMRMVFRVGSFGMLFLFYILANLYMSSSYASYSDAHRRLEGDDCPEPANPKEYAILYSVGVLWLFIGLSIVADELFVPALDLIAEKWKLTPDVAGATLMAAGGSSPELFTSAMGTFLRSSVGFGAIVGSAVFNLLFVVGVCILSVKEPMKLSWWPLLRDSTYYLFVLIMLFIFFGVNTPKEINWYEAVILHALYWIYVYIMLKNHNLYVYISKLFNIPLKTEVDAPETTLLFSSSSKVRSGLLKLLTENKPIEHTIGAHLATKHLETVEVVFNKYDSDGNGALSREEIQSCIKELGLELNDEEFTKFFQSIDTNGDGSIDFSEFSLWYLKSNERIEAEIQKQFNAIDKNNDKHLDRDELKQLLAIISVDASIDDDAMVEEAFLHGTDDVENAGSKNPLVTSNSALSKVATTTSKEFITYDEFSKWLKGSVYMTRKLDEAEAMEDAAEGLSLYPPESKTLFTMFWYIITLPFVAGFLLTVPNVQVPGNQKYRYVTFFTCLGWFGIFSYFMVTWIEVIGATAGIPSVIMGLTFLAAGTSVPDMLSAVIVAKQGEADKAISSSVGSNVFDICVGLAFPWILFIITYQESVSVNAGQLVISILALIACVAALVGTIKYCDWVCHPKMGYWFIFLYGCYVAQQLAIAKYGSC